MIDKFCLLSLLFYISSLRLLPNDSTEKSDTEPSWTACSIARILSRADDFFRFDFGFDFLEDFEWEEDDREVSFNSSTKSSCCDGRLSLLGRLGGVDGSGALLEAR